MLMNVLPLGQMCERYANGDGRCSMNSHSYTVEQCDACINLNTQTSGPVILNSWKSVKGTKNLRIMHLAILNLQIKKEEQIGKRGVLSQI